MIAPFVGATAARLRVSRSGGTPVTDRATQPTPPPDPNAVPITINGRAITARKGELVIAAAERSRHLHPTVLLPRADEPGRHVPDVPRRDRHRPRPDAASRRAWSRSPGHEGRDRVAGGEAGPGGHHRAAPRQPPARLPGLRQGRRVPAAGPGVQPRPGREPLRRGEAPLREADPDQRPRLPRPRALHPLRPLHPLRRRGRRRRARSTSPSAATRPR